MKIFLSITLALLCLPDILAGREGSAITIGRVKYEGGGDWYNDRSAEVNLLRFVAETTGLAVEASFTPVELASDRLFSFPFIFLTGHGNVRFTATEVEYLRSYLENGGFLYIDDDYGLDTAIRREMGRVLPERTFTELPFAHELYHTFFSFENGLPKIHEHDGQPPRGFGMTDSRGRLCVFYTWETNPSDGWADPEVHGDPPEKRLAALKIGTNILLYALTH